MNSLFEKTIAPCDPKAFLETYFEQALFHVQRDNGLYFQDVITLRDILDYLKRGDIAHPTIRVVKNGAEIPPDEYTKELTYKGTHCFKNIADHKKVIDLFEGGASLIFMHAHTSITKLGVLCKNFERFFGNPIQVTLYISPPSAEGLELHFDPHDVFVMQISGRKVWQVHDTPAWLPYVSDFLNISSEEQRQKTTNIHEISMHEGDTLYLPRGFLHKAKTQDTNSIHITLGLPTYRWLNLVHDLVDAGSDNITLRKSVCYNQQGSADLAQIKTDLRACFDQVLDTHLESVLSRASGPSEAMTVLDSIDRVFGSNHLKED